MSHWKIENDFTTNELSKLEREEFQNIEKLLPQHFKNEYEWN